jgi:hypothetical protein
MAILFDNTMWSRHPSKSKLAYASEEKRSGKQATKGTVKK